jgi:hypothetical protein
MPFFEVMGVHEASKKKEEEILFYPTWVVAEDEKSAAMRFIMELNEDEKEDIDMKRFKVLVRPF